MPPQKELDYLFFFPPSRKKYAARMGPKLKDAKVNPAVREWIGLFLNTWDLSTYPRLFERTGEKFSADVSPNYSRMSAEEIRRAAAVIPGATIVLTLRDPVERAWSHAKNASKTWNIADPGAKLERCSRFVNSAACDLMSDYPRLIRDWSAAFGMGRLAVVFYEELADRPVSFIDRILAFVGARPFPESLVDHLHQRHNSGESMPLPDEVRATLLMRYERMLNDLRFLLSSLPSSCGPRPGWLTGQTVDGYPESIQA